MMLDSCKMVKKQSEAFHTFLLHAFFPSLKQNFIAYRSSKVSSRPDYIFEIHQQWQSGFSRLYSNCCYSCSFEPGIIKIGQSSHKMYSNNIVKFPESLTILNACTKKVWKPIECTSYKYEYFSVFDRDAWYYITLCKNNVGRIKRHRVYHTELKHYSKRVRTLVALSRTLSDKYSC